MAAIRLGVSGSFCPVASKTPMRRTRSDCCPRAASGHAAAAPPSTVMKSRRFMSSTTPFSHFCTRTLVDLQSKLFDNRRPESNVVRKGTSELLGGGVDRGFEAGLDQCLLVGPFRYGR